MLASYFDSLIDKKWYLVFFSVDILHITCNPYNNPEELGNTLVYRGGNQGTESVNILSMYIGRQCSVESSGYLGSNLSSATC